MSTPDGIPVWGARARCAFIRVFSPLLGVALLGNALAAFDVDVAGAVERWHLTLPALFVLAVVSVGFVGSGVLWLVAEVRAGFAEPREEG